MSCNYAESLSHYENKGKLGLPEKFDNQEELERKCLRLAELIKNSSHTVVHTGAGISTAAGIPDFRGPNGVWTLEKMGKKPTINISWDEAKPTIAHMALMALHRAGYISYVITQNIDGLHLKSGLPRSCLSELHGNFFVDKCGKCHRQFVRREASRTVGQKSESMPCPGRSGTQGRRCRGKLFDTVLDWEDALPHSDLELAHLHSCAADVSLCVGTTLQIVPSGNLPVLTKKRGGSLVICNLQPTKQDRHADLIVNWYADDVLTRVLKILNVPLMTYDPSLDPVQKTQLLLKDTEEGNLPDDFTPVEWTIPDEMLNNPTLLKAVKEKKMIKRSSNSNTCTTSNGTTEVKEKKVIKRSNSNTCTTSNGTTEMKEEIDDNSQNEPVLRLENGQISSVNGDCPVPDTVDMF